MIEKLRIKNFKSIRDIELECAGVNLFIGEPNTGKSNILEALALLSWLGNGSKKDLKSYVRMERPQNLFYDEMVDRNVGISFEYEGNSYWVEMKLNGSEYLLIASGKGKEVGSVRIDMDGKVMSPSPHMSPMIFLKYYRFADTDISNPRPGSLETPSGGNLFTVVFASEKMRELVKSYFQPYELRLVFKPQERRFAVQKQQDDLVFEYPYELMSDTLRRMIFHAVAMESNKNAVLVFEEPESHAFPYYTKHLGERIAADTDNQYFIATHNPYLVSAVLEKSRDINVFVTYYSDYQTRIRKLTEEEMDLMLEMDPFFNLNRFLEERE